MLTNAPYKNDNGDILKYVGKIANGAISKCDAKSDLKQLTQTIFDT